MRSGKDSGDPWIVDGPWSARIGEAVRHGVAPLLYRRLRITDEPLPAGVAEALRDLYVHNELRNRTVWEQLSELLRELQGAGIPGIVLKGAHLAEIVYGDPALRPLADLDLLVRKRDLAAAADRLLAIGYSFLETGPPPGSARHHHLPPLAKPGAVPVEIHHALGARGLASAIPEERLWDRSRPARIAGVETRVLCPEDLLIHLCLHAAHNHRFEVPLLKLHDIAASLRCFHHEIDWPRLAAEANELRISRFLYSTLLLVREMLGAEVPAAFLDTLRHERIDREIVGTVRTFLLSDSVDLPVACGRFREARGALAKASVAASTLFPRAALRSRVARLFDLLVRGSGHLFAAMLRPERLRSALKRQEERSLIRRWVEDCADVAL